jgi:hypothetical protein
MSLIVRADVAKLIDALDLGFRFIASLRYFRLLSDTTPVSFRVPKTLGISPT